MKLSQAIKINPLKASRQELFEAVVDLKREYTKSAKAFERRNMTTEVLKTVQNRMSGNPELYDKKLGSMSVNELREVFSTFRDYHAHKTYNQEGRFEGWQVNKTRTLSGYQNYLHDVATNVLGYEEYEKLNQAQQRDIWSLIDAVRTSQQGEGYFHSSSITPNVAFQSGANIKEIMSYIKSGVTDPAELLNMLQQHVMQVQEEQIADDLPSVWDIM